MPTVQLDYGPTTTITMNLASLPHSSTLLVGRESTQIDNTVNNYADCLVTGIIQGFSPVFPQNFIMVYVWGSDTPLSSTNKLGGVLEGTDGARTFASLGQMSDLKIGHVTNSIQQVGSLFFSVLPFSVASLFGGVMPKYWGLFVTSNQGNLNANNNTNKFTYFGVKYDLI